MIDLRPGDKFSFGKDGCVYNVVRRKDDIAFIECDWIRGRVCVAMFDEKIPVEPSKG